jgi:protein TonB
MNPIFAPRPGGTPPASRPLVIAGVVSVALHGSVFAAASWLWVPTTPPEAPRLVAVAMVPETQVRSTRQSKRVGPGAKPDVDRQRARAALRAAKRRAQTAAKPAIPATHRSPLVHPIWGKAPPAPPSLPHFRLSRILEPRLRAHTKPQTPDPRANQPVVTKIAPPIAAPGGAGNTAQTAKTTQGKSPGAKGPPRPVAGPGNAAPAYPWISRSRGEQGRVILDVAVTADGHAKEVRIKRSSGSARLDRAALAAVKRWRFLPALSGGRAVAGRIDVPIAFRLTK